MKNKYCTWQFGSIDRLQRYCDLFLRKIVFGVVKVEKQGNKTSNNIWWTPEFHTSELWITQRFLSWVQHLLKPTFWDMVLSRDYWPYFYTHNDSQHFKNPSGLEGQLNFQQSLCFTTKEWWIILCFNII